MNMSDWFFEAKFVRRLLLIREHYDAQCSYKIVLMRKRSVNVQTSILLKKIPESGKRIVGLGISLPNYTPFLAF